MAYYLWIVVTGDKEHSVEMVQSLLLWHRPIRIDGRELSKQDLRKELAHDGSTHYMFAIEDHHYYLVIRPRGSRLSCELYVEGRLIEPQSFESSITRSYFLTMALTGTAFAVVLFVLFYGLPTLLRGPGWIKDPLEVALVAILLGTGSVLLVFGFSYLSGISEEKRGREATRWLLALLMGVIIMLTLFFWADTGNRMVGVMAVALEGGPGWILLLPLFAGTITVLLVYNFVGSHYLVVPLTWLMAIALVFAVYPATRAGQSGSSIAWGGIPHMIMAIGALSLSLVFIIGSEHPPLNSFFARFQYPGSVGHYRGLQRIAERYELEIIGPSKGTNGQMYLRGLWEGRPIDVFSVNERFEVTLASISELTRISLIPGSAKAAFPQEGQVLERQIKLSDSRPAKLYVWPIETAQLEDGAFDALASQFSAGSDVLQKRTGFWAEGPRVVFRRAHVFRKSLSEGQVLRSIEWIYSTVRMLESSGFAVPPHPATG